MADDAEQGASPQWIMERDGNGDGGCLQPLLHDRVAASLAYRGESVLCQVRQTSWPDRTRSLPNRYLDLSNEDLSVRSAGGLRQGCGLEEPGEGFDQVRRRLFDRSALTGDVELRAQRYEAVVFALDDGRQAVGRVHIASLLHPPDGSQVGGNASSDEGEFRGLSQ